MSEPAAAPRARIVEIQADRTEICLGAITRAERCDLALVDRVLRLRLTAVRAGGTLVLREADVELVLLLDLLGLRDLLLG